jgi:two-component system chemotaxis response regulator CheY
MTKCLIVEGSKSDRDSLERLLAAYGFELNSIGDAQSALDQCRRAMPDVVLVADRLGHMDAVSFIKRLRGHTGRGRPAVFVYGDTGDPEHIGRAIWEGATECLVKPFDAEVLDSKLRQAGVV